MKKRGYTLVELMVSIAILSIVLGSISLIMTSYVETYDAGMKYEETGKQRQTFFSYVVSDLNLEEYDGTSVGEEPHKNTESDDEKYFSISKVVDNGKTKKIIIRERSWDEETPKNEITYEFLDEGIKRNGSFILKKNRNFDLRGMDLKIYKNEIVADSKISSNPIDYLKGGSEVDIATEKKLPIDEGDTKNSYYIEAILKVGEDKDIKRGYAFRFSNVKKGNGNEVDPEEPEGDKDIVKPPGVGAGSGISNENKLDIPDNSRYWLIITFDSEAFWNRTEDGTEWDEITKDYVFQKVEFYSPSNDSVLHSKYDVIETVEESSYFHEKRMKFYFEVEAGASKGNSGNMHLQIHPSSRYRTLKYEYYFKYRY